MVLKALLPIVGVELVLLTGCSSNNGGGMPAAAQNAMAQPMVKKGLVGQYISHVVVIIQENRSFENFFAGYPGANAPLTGCVGTGKSKGAVLRPTRHTSASGCPNGDTVVPLTPITFNGPDLQHNWGSARFDYDKGRMDGFYKFGNKGKNGAYAYVKQSLVQPYWDMANQYVLADAMFPTEFGGSFTGHLTAVAGNDNLTPTQAEVDFPNGQYDDCDSPPGTKSSYITTKQREHYYQGPFPCFDQWNTMANVLDAAGVSWKYYATKLVGAGMWEPYEAMKYVRYGPDWNTNIIAPQTTILTDPAAGQLASVTWVSPSKPDSDHPTAHSDQGPSWVASVVNAIGESSYWNTTAIVVIWDDWGGWYDNATPPQLDFRGLGIRVPCLIISPYAKQGVVSHTQYEYGSILRFIEQAFNLPPIGPAADGYTDRRAKSIVDSFDFTQSPRPFVPIASKYPMSHFIHEPPSDEPVDTE